MFYLSRLLGLIIKVTSGKPFDGSWSVSGSAANACATIAFFALLRHLAQVRQAIYNRLDGFDVEQCVCSAEDDVFARISAKEDDDAFARASAAEGLAMIAAREEELWSIFGTTEERAEEAEAEQRPILGTTENAQKDCSEALRRGLGGTTSRAREQCLRIFRLCVSCGKALVALQVCAAKSRASPWGRGSGGS